MGLDNWKLLYNIYEPAQEGAREALCTLGNGYFATRGAAEESHDDGLHYPGTYLAGGYNRLTSHINGKDIDNEDLVNLPNWLCLTFRLNGGPWFRLDDVEILDYCQELDLKQGLLSRQIHFKLSTGEALSLQSRRLVCRQMPHHAALEWTLTSEDWTGTLELQIALDGGVVNNNVKSYQGLNNRHLQTLSLENPAPETLFLKVQMVQSHLQVAMATKTRVALNGQPVSAERSH